MDKAQFEREKQYGAASAIARQLLRCGLITQEEYQKLTVVLAQKYRPVIRQSATGNLSPVHRTVIKEEKGGFGN